MGVSIGIGVKSGNNHNNNVWNSYSDPDIQCFTHLISFNAVKALQRERSSFVPKTPSFRDMKKVTQDYVCGYQWESQSSGPGLLNSKSPKSEHPSLSPSSPAPPTYMALAYRGGGTPHTLLSGKGLSGNVFLLCSLSAVEASMLGHRVQKPVWGRTVDSLLNKQLEIVPDFH